MKYTIILIPTRQTDSIRQMAPYNLIGEYPLVDEDDDVLEMEMELDEVLTEQLPIAPLNNMDEIVRALEGERDTGNIVEPEDAPEEIEEEGNAQLIPGLRLDDLRNGNEEEAARIRNLAAAGNLHARVLIQLHEERFIDDDNRSVDSSNDERQPQQIVPFESEVNPFWFKC